MKIKTFILSLFVMLPILSFAGETININTANKETLQTIKGVGEKRAETIIKYREEHGPFKSVQELAEVPGVGSSTIDSNKDILTVENSD